MTHWILFAVAVLGAIMVFVTKSSLLAGIGVLMVLAGLIGATFSLAGRRIADRSRADTAMLSPEVLQAIREKAARDAARRDGRSLPPGEE